MSLRSSGRRCNMVLLRWRQIRRRLWLRARQGQGSRLCRWRRQSPHRKHRRLRDVELLLVVKARLLQAVRRLQGLRNHGPPGVSSSGGRRRRRLLLVVLLLLLSCRYSGGRLLLLLLRDLLLLLRKVEVVRGHHLLLFGDGGSRSGRCRRRFGVVVRELRRRVRRVGHGRGGRHGGYRTLARHVVDGAVTRRVRRDQLGRPVRGAGDLGLVGVRLLRRKARLRRRLLLRGR